ncbi:8-oxo-dGTP diphosphatase [Actinacidiphila yanglinensis]|uniref:8-oxo-dGTP diphosphatase n=1 Tax=Actinacidiphila yanglinensis TaxID=310779 RepID=A0A1H6EBH5_9ACTN|nr:NUDIX domain-containing protein [Actinacidiphila yanglinensis]SEG95107.1 8-oxo-dGTP diphosphatase [Actinacidiphila yanglinensis]
MNHAADGRPGISAAVVVRGGLVLLVRRRVAEGRLSWQFPAGAVEPGETPQEAAVRETFEETGVDVTAIRVLGGRVHPMTGRFVTYTACEIPPGTTRVARVAAEEEVAEVAWCTRSELDSRIPYGVFGPVRAYLDRALTR